MSKSFETEPQDQLRPLAEGISDVKTLLGDRIKQVFPADKTVIGIIRENYQSIIYQINDSGAYPEFNGTYDRTMYIIAFSDLTEVIITTSRIYYANEDEVKAELAAGNRPPNRKTGVYQNITPDDIAVFETNTEFDKKRAITDLNNTFLPLIRRQMGRLVSKEEFGPASTSTVT